MRVWRFRVQGLAVLLLLAHAVRPQPRSHCAGVYPIIGLPDRVPIAFEARAEVDVAAGAHIASQHVDVLLLEGVAGAPEVLHHHIQEFGDLRVRNPEPRTPKAQTQNPKTLKPKRPWEPAGPMWCRLPGSHSKGRTRSTVRRSGSCSMHLLPETSRLGSLPLSLSLSHCLSLSLSHSLSLFFFSQA